MFSCAPAPPRTGHGADRHGCNSARRTPLWALGHGYGPLQDCIARRITDRSKN